MVQQIKEDTADHALARFGSLFFSVLIKGIKDATKVEIMAGDKVSDAIGKSLKRFEMATPYLDLDQVGRMDECECFFDVGVTITPPNDPPLVGLLRLDHLDASFGAGGFKMGDAHRIGCLDRYGGLQAETLASHEAESHVTHSSAYPVVYQKFRKANNSVDWFTLKDVAKNTNAFKDDFGHLEKVLRMEAYEAVSFGVRREFRVGLEALCHMRDEDEAVLVSC